MPRTSRLLALAALSTSWSACTTSVSSDNLDIHDHGVPFPSLRLELPLQRTPEGRPDPHSRFGLGQDLTYGRGTYLGGTESYELKSAQTYFQAGLPRRAPHGFVRGLVGLEYLHLEVDDPTPSTFDDEAGGAFGPLLGFDAGWAFAPFGDAYVRGTASGLLPDTTSARIETGVRMRPATEVELFAAWRWWRVRRDDAFDLGTADTLDLHTDGVVFGMTFIF